MVTDRIKEMGIKWMALGVGGLACLSILPVLMIQFSGPAGAGISAGFAEPFDHTLHVALFAIAGMVALRRGSFTLFMLPLAMMLMLAIGAMSDISLAQLPATRMWTFAFIMLFALTVSIGYSRVFFTTVSIASAFSYFAGTQYIATAPNVASLGYFLLGCMLSSGLILACGASLSLALGEYITKLIDRLQRVPAVASFMMFF